MKADLKIKKIKYDLQIILIYSKINYVSQIKFQVKKKRGKERGKRE